jgi:histidine triad (HIT) family protein
MPGEPDFDKMSPEEISEYQKQNCIFCKIIKGEIPSRKAYEDDKLVAIMDINPAAKGHLLMMTKEHYQVLPLIPPDVAAYMFRITKDLSGAVKKALVTDKVTIFMANGGVAGQQSPHFLYHIIPRENGDSLDNFNIPQKEITEEELADVIAPIKGKLGLSMRSYNAQIRKKDEQKEQSKEAMKEQPKQSDDVGVELQSPAPTKPAQQDLAKFIFDNPKIKDKIISDPEGFKKDVESNALLKSIFQAVNINKLSEALKRMG